MSLGAGYQGGAGEGGYGNPIGVPGGLLASEADREATQAVLKKAFEDERLTQDEFEARVGHAVAARTQGELANLTRDLPPLQTPRAGRRRRRGLLLGTAITAIVLAGIGFGLSQVFSSSPARPASAARPSAATKTGPPSTGPAGCPVGTSATALSIANALAQDPVYVGPGSSLLTAAQAGDLQTEIGRYDPGRIRIAAVTAATMSSGGGERALANAIASCQADGAGTTLVTNNQSTYVVTSYPDNSAATQAIGAALNTHATLAAGLKDAIRRIAIVEKDSS
jgi:hypothetical protein